MTTSDDITAVITAGGRASRFGRDKALALLAKEPLIVHVAKGLEVFSERLLICPDGHYSFLNWPSTPDLKPGYGALGGLFTALKKSHTSWLAFAATDMPLLTPDYWRLLASRRAVQAVVPLNSRGRYEPLAALYHKSALPHVEAHMEEGIFAMHALIRKLDVAEIGWEEVRGFGDHLFHNVNTLKDLEAIKGAED